MALPRGSLVVNSSQGGGSKDTWVLAGGEKNQPGAEAMLGQSAADQLAGGGR